MDQALIGVVRKGFWRIVWLAAGLVLATTAGAATEGGKDRPTTALASFAGGCFWCVEEAFDRVEGVLSTTSGFMGGAVEGPSYEQVAAGGTGHREVVQVVYDPARVSYEQLLAHFWRNVDPTQKDGQFCDSGEQYRSEIFVHDDAQRHAALASRAALERDERFRGQIQTPITLASAFYPAAESHQDFHRRNFVQYSYYKAACGRSARLRFLWRDR